MAGSSGDQDMAWFDQILKSGDLAKVSKSPLCLLLTFDPR
jgi:hypothetical protein